jgi:DNA polymerase-3 subunit alpha
VDAKRIRYGLGGVKGTGAAAIEAVVAARTAGGPFRDLFDFCRRIDRRVVNRRAIEALVRAGAFDAIEPRRAALLATVGIALDAAERAQAFAAQVSLFGEDAAGPEHALVATRDWSDAERLQHEKAAIGFYLSGHPFAAYAAELATVTRTTLANLAPRQERVLVAGIVTQIRTQASRRGKMAFVTLDDGHASAEIMVYSELLDTARALLREDQLVIAEIKVAQRMTDDGEAQGLRIVAEAVYDLAAIRRTRAKRLRLACNGNASAATLAEILAPYRPGDKPIVVSYCNDRIGGEIELSPDWQVNLDDALIDRLREWLRPENVQVLYS